MPGRFISIEGGDGAGKSTQLEVIGDTLREHGLEYIVSREPGGTPIGEALRALLLDHGEFSIADEAELLLMFAARSQHVHSVIKPALAQGKWVVSDRFHDASFAYQGARGLNLQRVQELSDWVLQDFKPDLTLLFDMPVEQGLQRVGKRGEPDRFERESIDYKHRVQEIYRARALAEPSRIRRIDASRDIEGVSSQVRVLLRSYIEEVAGAR